MTTSQTLKTTFRVLSNEGFVSVQENLLTGQKALFANRPFQTGDLLCSFSDQGVFAKPERLTLQTGINQHIFLTPEFLQYTNHSCAPNIFFDTTARQVICLNDIQEGAEIVFFYPATEWEMAEPFACRCGSAQCGGEIRGF